MKGNLEDMSLFVKHERMKADSLQEEIRLLMLLSGGQPKGSRVETPLI